MRYLISFTAVMLVSFSSYAQEDEWRSLGYSELAPISEEISEALRFSVRDADSLTRANSREIQAAFTRANQFVNSVLQRRGVEIGAKKKLRLVKPVLESIGESLGGFANPYTDLDTAQFTRTPFEKFVEMTRVGVAYIGDQFKYWLLSWNVLRNSNMETPLETHRRTRIGKKVIEQTQSMMETYVTLVKPESVKTDPIVDQMARIVDTAVSVEPMRYRVLNRTMMWGWAAFTAFYALLPRVVHEHIIFAPPADYFPPFTLMEATQWSYATARALFVIYGLLGYYAIRHMSGYALGTRIMALRRRFEELVGDYKRILKDGKMAATPAFRSQRRSPLERMRSGMVTSCKTVFSL